MYSTIVVNGMSWLLSSFLPKKGFSENTTLSKIKAIGILLILQIVCPIYANYSIIKGVPFDSIGHKYLGQP